MTCASLNNPCDVRPWVTYNNHYEITNGATSLLYKQTASVTDTFDSYGNITQHRQLSEKTGAQVGYRRLLQTRLLSQMLPNG